MKRLSLILWILLPTCLVWGVRQWHLHVEHQQWQFMRSQLAALQGQIRQLEADLLAARHQRVKARQDRDRVLARIVSVESGLAEANPESFWAEPPSDWPFWDDASPYVWLPKDALGKFKAPVFTDNGFLRREVLAVLALTPDQAREVGLELSGILGEFHELQRHHLAILEQPLPGMWRSDPHRTIALDPLPVEARVFRQRFEETLRRHLGDQRAEVLLAAGASWMKEHLPASTEDPTVYSLSRRQDGTFRIGIVRDGTSLFTGGPSEVSSHIPDHLMPFFAEWIDEQRARAPVQP